MSESLTSKSWLEMEWKILSQVSVTVCYSIICLKLWHESKSLRAGNSLSLPSLFRFCLFTVFILWFGTEMFLLLMQVRFPLHCLTHRFTICYGSCLYSTGFFLASLSLDFKYMQMVISGHSLLFPWCINPCLCQYYTIWMILRYGLKV